MELGVVVSCYNEEKVLPETAARLATLLAELEAGKKIASGRIHFVDDGSDDRTWEVIEALARESQRFHGIKLSRNRGHQNALLAGLLTAPGDVLISMDADLQDDPGAIHHMLDEHRKGSDIVYGVRRSRETDSFFKRFTALTFYRLMAVLGVELVEDHADFRLMSRRAVEALRQFPEKNLFLRGLVPLIGFPMSSVRYDRQARRAGESKYPLLKMLAFAFEGITSFSVVPLRLIFLLGLLTFFGSLGLSIWVLAIRFLTDRAVPGWASTVLPIYFIGGVQIVCVGVIGEYLGRIYAEVKARPRYVIEKTTS
jgi:glycosyltransferase involved in cell wall biosynthesis